MISTMTLIVTGLNLPAVAGSDVSLVTVAYDQTEEYYREFNPAFAAHWKKKSGTNVSIKSSYGPSSKQAAKVIDGAEADIVTLELAYDIDAIQNKGLIEPGWRKRLPNNGSPFSSTIVFLTRKGNPKNITGWNDLVQPGILVVTPNPKTSGGGRWNYLAAWGYALKEHNGDEASALEFVSQLYRNAPRLTSGARGAMDIFRQEHFGDVLLLWEHEAYQTLKETGDDKYVIVTPATSIKAEPSVSSIDKVVDQRGNRAVADAYLNHLFAFEGQVIAVKHHLRPVNRKVEIALSRLPQVKFFTIDELFGSWPQAQQTHFADGGIFDRIRPKKE
jgi:sulfate transport system substrate-binding protein